ncbi:uncharacterized protein LOC144647516 [Oculina patagonica]
MTRGKRRAVPSTQSQKASSKKQGSKRSAPPAAKRAKTVQAINEPEAAHPSRLERSPLVARGNSSTLASTSEAQQAILTPVGRDISIPALTSAISAAVIKGLTDSGVISSSSNKTKEHDKTMDANISVQDSVDEVVQDLTGEGHDTAISSFVDTLDTNNRPQQVHKLISVPLASRVPEKIQNKIWANEYVDLGNLCVSIPGDPKYNFTVKTSSTSQQPVVSLEPVQQTKRIATIDHWTSAFQIFVAIYTIRFPECAPALMKYSATVRDLAAKNAHWRYYDENFRYLRQKSLFPWDEMQWELWLQAHHMNRSSFQTTSPSNSTRPAKQSFPRGYCWKFHQGDTCFGCNFKHECFKCGATHPAFRCRVTKDSKSSAAPSRPVRANTSTNTNSSK